METPAEVKWETEHSVETAAPLDFTWKYMTDVANWHDPPAQVRLEGPFAAGSNGVTELPGQPVRHWQLQTVTPLKSYRIELRLDRGSLSFEWRFAALPKERTRLTQHLALTGENASEYVEDVQRGFTPNLAAGMKRIATAIDAAFAAS